MARKFSTGQEEIEKLIDGCAMIGRNTIELQWLKGTRIYPAEIIGIEYPHVRLRKTQEFQQNLETDVRWVDGSIIFYPDKNGICFGYVCDTENNRITLAKLIKTGMFKIVDDRVRVEIEKLAISIGETLEVLKQDPIDFYVRKNVNVELKRKDSEKKELEDQIAKLNATVEKLKNKLVEKIEDLPKPLAHVRISEAKKEALALKEEMAA